MDLVTSTNVLISISVTVVLVFVCVDNAFSILYKELSTHNDLDVQRSNKATDYYIPTHVTKDGEQHKDNM